MKVFIVVPPYPLLKLCTRNVRKQEVYFRSRRASLPSLSPLPHLLRRWLRLQLRLQPRFPTA